MTYLKKASNLSEFENEIRNPGPALKDAIIQMRKDRSIQYDNAKSIIDKAIESDIGWNRQDIIDYFDCYSDCYKDCHNIRPHYNYIDEYYDVVYSWMVEAHHDTNYYMDYSALSYDDDDYYEDETVESEPIDGVTLNDEPVMNNIEVDDERWMNEYYDPMEQTDEDIYDARPLQQSHHRGVA